MAVALRMKTIKYNTEEWKKFYDSLALVFKIEKELSEADAKKSEDSDDNESDSGMPRLSELFEVAKSEYMDILRSIDRAEE